MSDTFPVAPPPSRVVFSAGLPPAVRQALADSFVMFPVALSGQGPAFAENLIYLAWLWNNGYVLNANDPGVPAGPRRAPVIPNQELDVRADFDASYFPEQKKPSWIYYSYDLDSLEELLRGLAIG